MPGTTEPPCPSPLLERLRAALAPDYAVERELASGGMGIVFLARDVTLDRPVAIKVIRPELATASAAERFLREARALASLTHPCVVPVHRAGEAGGFSYYVMDYVDAGTLEGRLRRGALPPGEAVGVATDVLAALGAAHEKGIVHRDVKPANIFLVGDRAVLGDFGIAKTAAPESDGLTLPGCVVGTPDYMAPEQATGHAVTPATDQYAVGLVLYEALTGRRWPSLADPEGAEWSGVPRPLVPTLGRALALEPTARWPDAGAFARALRRVGPPARARRVLLWTAGIAAAAAAVALVIAAPWRDGADGVPAGALEVAIRPLRVIGTGAPPWLGESLAVMLERELGAGPDFEVRLTAAGARDASRPGLLLDGTATVRGDSLALAVTAHAGAGAASVAFRAETTGTLAEWPRIAADLAYPVLWHIWQDAHGPLAADLPRAALPRTTEGLRAYLGAELLAAQARWRTAYEAYLRAAEIDSSCVLCDLRLTDVGRWLGVEADTARTRRYRAARQLFPPQYQLLIDASFAPEPERLTLLRDLTERHRGWGFGFFIRADEIFHRGAFAGWRRRDALEPLEQAAVLRPDFAPIWEHLAWLLIAEGDSAGAARAVQRYAGVGAQADATGAAIGALLQTGFAWRFLPEPAARALSEAALADPAIGGSADIGAAPSNLLALEVPRAAVWLGEQFAHGRPRRGLETTGRLAQVHGLLATGRADSALAVATRLAAETSDPAIALYAAELPVALALANPEAAAPWERLSEPLARLAGDAAATPPSIRARATWMLALLAHRTRHGGELTPLRQRLTSLERGDGPLGALVTAYAGPGGHGFPDMALRATDALVALDSAFRAGDPFFRMLLHLARADWAVTAERRDLAARELRWHENNDFVHYAGPGPQAVEVDYAFGPLAQWRRARLLETLGPAFRDEACASYAAVARAWLGGDPRYAARADSAAARRRTLACSTPL